MNPSEAGGEGLGGMPIYTYLIERSGATYLVYDNEGVLQNAGTNAATMINWAFTTGGAGTKVYLREQTTFATVDPIQFTANEQWLFGGGYSSFIDGDGLGNNEHAVVISAYTDCVVKDLSVQTQDGGGNTSHCVFIEDGANGFLVEHVNVLASDDVGIYIARTTITRGDINGCYITGTDGKFLLSLSRS